MVHDTRELYQVSLGIKVARKVARVIFESEPSPTSIIIALASSTKHSVTLCSICQLADPAYQSGRAYVAEGSRTVISRTSEAQGRDLGWIGQWFTSRPVDLSACRYGYVGRQYKCHEDDGGRIGIIVYHRSLKLAEVPGTS